MKARKRRPRDSVQANIDQYGRSVFGVFADEDSTDPVNESFTYSIGNATKDLPELLLVGTCDAGGIINALSEQMVERGAPFAEGEIVNFGKPWSVCIISASEAVKKQYTLQATYHYGSDDCYSVMQVVCTDEQGRFPWQEGCAEPYGLVTVHRRLHG